MTINKVLERVDKTRPNALDIETKARWLLELENKLWEEVVLRHEDPPAAGAWYGRATSLEHMDVELVAREPYDELYAFYLESRIDRFHGEDTAYAQSAALFNDALDQWRVRWHRDHMPVPGPGIKTI